ncbi:DnaJ domain-containing protein [Candidatus Nitrosotenuis uzonensis]|uniref:Type I membrane protein n=1 Tax=Candidatus Nitrosotenuis uzonensis TaxID=1407055 RepID=V6ARY4_9ARCH
MRLIFAALALALLSTIVLQSQSAYSQQGGLVVERPTRGSEEISEYYNVNDVRLAMAIVGAAVVGVFLYLAREIILRRKTEYEKKNYASKQNRDYEKYHSDWNADDEDFIGPRKRKSADEFRKMFDEATLPNYYNVLGVSVDATLEEIKRKYRQLVKEYHPDRTKDAKSAEKFAEITSAYEVLSDEEQRKMYDSYFKTSVG